MIYLFNYVSFLCHRHWLVDHCLDIIVVVTHELLGSQIFEVLLDLREDQFNRVVPERKNEIKWWKLYLLWRIGQVVNPSEAVLLHRRPGLLRDMNTKIIHEQADLGCPIGLLQAIDLCYLALRLTISTHSFHVVSSQNSEEYWQCAIYERSDRLILGHLQHCGFQPHWPPTRFSYPVAGSFPCSL